MRCGKAHRNHSWLRPLAAAGLPAARAGARAPGLCGGAKPSIRGARQQAARLASGTTTIYDVLADATIVGRIMKVHAAPEGLPWMWTLAFGHHEDRTPTHGYEPTREAAMAAFAKNWRRE